MLTADDATLAAAADRAGVDVLLVGDSLGMVVQGHAATLPVSLDDVLYHTQCVAAARTSALVIADLPFGTYAASAEAAYAASAAALKAGASMVKVEGGSWLLPTVEFLTDGTALAAAGASMLVVECVPTELGAALTSAVKIAVIDIGAGPHCSGQVLVVYDALGVTATPAPRFVRNFMKGQDSIEGAMAAFVAAVKDGSIPAPEHCY